MRVHHPHAGGRRARRLQPRSDHRASSAISFASSASPVDRLLELARAPSAPGLFNMTRLALNGTRHVNAVSRIHGAVSLAPLRRPVAGDSARGKSGRLRHQRRARTDLPASELGGFLRPRRSAHDWRERLRDARFLDGASSSCRMRATGRPRSPSNRRCSPSVRERLQREFARKGLSQRALAPRHAHRSIPTRPEHADHRFRAPLRHLQARNAAAARPRAAGKPGQRSRAPGAVPVCRQGASGR